MGSMQAESWNSNTADIFWGEIDPRDHLVQVYDCDETFIETLKGFVHGGFIANESVIIIASEGHIHSLNIKLKESGFDVHTLTLNGQYMPLNAEEMLTQFMKNGWPDEVLFTKLVTRIVHRGKGSKGRKIRAYSELVALLWTQGNCGATLHLEHMWNKLRETELFPLFCAYPLAGLSQDPNGSIQHICSTHTKMILGKAISSSEVLYKNLPS